MLVEPRRNQSSSRTTALKSTFLVVTSGKTLAQIVFRLRAEHAHRPSPGAVVTLFAVIEDVLYQLQVLLHER